MPGLVYTPVELGTIRLGHLVEKEGTATPVMDDKFTITRLVKRKGGQWIEHPLDAELRNELPSPRPEEGLAEPKLREIPIRIMYDSPDLTIRSRYEAFDLKRLRPVCASTIAGRAKRLHGGVAREVDCLGPDHCEFAQGSDIRCKFFGRITVQIEGQTEADNGFVLRSTSINTLRNFEAKLTRYWALFGKRLTGVPFRLMLRTKTTASSFWRPFYFCDLELPKGMTPQQAVRLAKRHAKLNESAGLDIQAWEAVVRAGLANGLLAAESDVEGELMKEFYCAGLDAEKVGDGEVESTAGTPRNVEGPSTSQPAPTARTLEEQNDSGERTGLARSSAHMAESNVVAHPAPAVRRVPSVQVPRVLAGSGNPPPGATVLAVIQRPPVRQSPVIMASRDTSPGR